MCMKYFGNNLLFSYIAWVRRTELFSPSCPYCLIAWSCCMICGYSIRREIANLLFVVPAHVIVTCDNINIMI